MSPPRYAQRLWKETCEAHPYEPGLTRHRVLADAFAQRLMEAGVPAYVMGRDACPCCLNSPHDTVAVPGHVLHMDVHASNLAVPELVSHQLDFGAHWNIPPLTACELCGASEYKARRFNLDIDSRQNKVLLCDTCAEIVGVDTYQTRDLIIGWSPNHPTRTLAFSGPAGNSLRRMLGWETPALAKTLRDFYSRFVCVNVHHEDPKQARPSRTVSAAWARELDSFVEESDNVIVAGIETARALELENIDESHFGFPVRLHATGKKVLCIVHPGGGHRDLWTPSAASRLYSAIIEYPLNSKA